MPTLTQQTGQPSRTAQSKRSGTRTGQARVSRFFLSEDVFLKFERWWVMLGIKSRSEAMREVVDIVTSMNNGRPMSESEINERLSNYNPLARDGRRIIEERPLRHYVRQRDGKKVGQVRVSEFWVEDWLKEKFVSWCDLAQVTQADAMRQMIEYMLSIPLLVKPPNKKKRD